jgi:hypothetical protein
MCTGCRGDCYPVGPKRAAVRITVEDEWIEVRILTHARLCRGTVRGATANSENTAQQDAPVYLNK